MASNVFRDSEIRFLFQTTAGPHCVAFFFLFVFFLFVCFVQRDRHINSEEICDSACYIIIIYLHMSWLWHRTLLLCSCKVPWLGKGGGAAEQSSAHGTGLVQAALWNRREGRWVGGSVCADQNIGVSARVGSFLYGVLKPHNASLLFLRIPVLHIFFVKDTGEGQKKKKTLDHGPPTRSSRRGASTAQNSFLTGRSLPPIEQDVTSQM